MDVMMVRIHMIFSPQLQLKITTGRNLRACRWHSEGNKESKDFAHNLTLEAGFI